MRIILSRHRRSLARIKAGGKPSARAPLRFLRRRAKGWVSKIAQKRARAAVPSPDLLRLGERRRSAAPTTSRRASSLANALTRRVAAAFSSAEINILCGAEIVGFDRQRLAQAICRRRHKQRPAVPPNRRAAMSKKCVWGISSFNARRTTTRLIVERRAAVNRFLRRRA